MKIIFHAPLIGDKVTIIEPGKRNRQGTISDVRPRCIKIKGYPQSFTYAGHLFGQYRKNKTTDNPYAYLRIEPKPEPNP